VANGEVEMASWSDALRVVMSFSLLGAGTLISAELNWDARQVLGKGCSGVARAPLQVASRLEFLIGQSMANR
jgi:hypothetical protein